jgi:hypothetical protein
MPSNYFKLILLSPLFYIYRRFTFTSNFSWHLLSSKQSPNKGRDIMLDIWPTWLYK